MGTVEQPVALLELADIGGRAGQTSQYLRQYLATRHTFSPGISSWWLPGVPRAVLAALPLSPVLEPQPEYPIKCNLDKSTTQIALLNTVSTRGPLQWAILVAKIVGLETVLGPFLSSH